MASAEIVKIEPRVHVAVPADADVAIAEFGKALVEYMGKYDRNLTRDQRGDLYVALRNITRKLGS